MSNNQIPNSNIPDYSGENDRLEIIRVITRPLVEGVQRFREALQLAFERALQDIPRFIKQTLEDVVLALSAIDKLGEAQFVCWDYLTPDFIKSINESGNINKTLREYMIQDKYKTVNDTIEKSIISAVLKKYKRLYIQSVEAFRTGSCDLAVTGFTSVFDGILSETSQNPTHRLAPRKNIILQKLDSNEVLDHDEYAILALATTLENTLESFSSRSDFSKKEPKGLNRHWIAHGRSTRKKTKLDCVKMINLIYGILLIEELDTKVNE